MVSRVGFGFTRFGGVVTPSDGTVVPPTDEWRPFTMTASNFPTPTDEWGAFEMTAEDF